MSDKSGEQMTNKERLSNIYEQWVEYCDGMTKYATVDDWTRFVNGVYVAWRRKMSNVDLRCIHTDGMVAIRDYIEQTYSFARFMTLAPEFKELQRLDPNKFE